MYPQDAANLVLAGLRADGVDVRLNTGTERVSKNDDGSVTVDLADGNSVSGREAAGGHRPPCRPGGTGPGSRGPWRRGRQSAAAPHGYHRAGGGHRRAATRRWRRRRRPWLYAVGDAAGKVMLTHQGKYSARATGDAIAARAKGELQERRRRGAASRRPPTTMPSPTWCSRIPSSPAWAGPWAGGEGRLQRLLGGTPHQRVRLLAAFRALRGLGAAGGGRGPEGAARGHVRRARTWPSSSTPPPSPWWARCPWTGCGMRCRPIPPSARCGCGCSRSTASELAAWSDGSGPRVCLVTSAIYLN